MTRPCKAFLPLAVLLLCMLPAACGVPDFGDSEAGLALEDMASGQAGSRLSALAPLPGRTTVSYTHAAQERAADLYRPSRDARAAIVLVPGVAARGWRDPRVVAIARTLARLDFTVLVPDMPGVRQSRMRAGDVGEVVDAFTWLAARPALAPPGHCGLAGFSYGAGPVVLAALAPQIRERARFVLSVGGYYSLENVVTYLTTGYYAVPGSAGTAAAAGRRSPHPYGQATFIRSNLDLLEEPHDRDFFRRYAAYIAASRPEEDEPQPRYLAADAAAFYALLDNPLAARVPALLQGLAPRMRTELNGIDPAARDLSELRATVILLHGRGDNLIPYTESIALANALPAGRAQLFLIDGLAHVDFRPQAHDVPQLLGAMEALLAMRAPPP